MTTLDKESQSRPAGGRKGSPVKGRPAAVHRDKKSPHAALHAPIRAPRYSAPRRLTGQQLKNPLLRMAFSRLRQIGDLRGKYLRDLDTIHGGRRTRSEKFDALAKASEQMLLRLDLATGVLGWLDVERGQYFLNTQCGIAEDCEMSPASLNRLMHSMDLAGYVYRRIEKVRLDEKDEAGLNLVRTRVLVRFTEKFFADLGVRYLWYRAKRPRSNAETRSYAKSAACERHVKKRRPWKRFGDSNRAATGKRVRRARRLMRMANTKHLSLLADHLEG